MAASKPASVAGNADVCAYMIPDFQRKNFCDAILGSPWSE